MNRERALSLWARSIGRDPTGRTRIFVLRLTVDAPDGQRTRGLQIGIQSVETNETRQFVAIDAAIEHLRAGLLALATPENGAMQ